MTNIDNSPPFVRIRVLSKSYGFLSDPLLCLKTQKITSEPVITIRCSCMPFGDELENQNPTLYLKTADRFITEEEQDDSVVDDFDQREIFDLIRGIKDPEHPLTLEELHVVQQDLITVKNDKSTIHVYFTPTIPHCSMATLIGLSIRVKLLRCLPSRFKVKVEVTPGTHNAESQVNKQLADKERVAAALENFHLIKVINQCIAPRNRG